MKTKEILLFLGIIAILLFIPCAVKAANSDVTLQKIEVTAPAEGKYTTGQEITIVATYSGNLQTTQSEPRITLKFSGSTNQPEVTGTISGNTTTFKYTLTDADKGHLSVSWVTGINDAAGNAISSVSAPTLEGSKITSNYQPVTWTDVSNKKIEIKENSSRTVGESYDLYVSGITEISEHRYFTYIVNGTTKVQVSLNSAGMVESGNVDYVYSGIHNPIHTDGSYRIDKHLEKSGDLYLYILETVKNDTTGEYECKFIIDGEKLDRPDQEQLGKRLLMYFNDNCTPSLFVLEPNDISKNRTVEFKIGKIEDSSILKLIKDGNYSGMQKLLTYAKNSNAIYTGTANSDGSGATALASTLNLTDRDYYFVYMKLDNENGTYYDVEDVDLYQAVVDKTTNVLIKQTDSKFKWNIVENPTSNETIKTNTTDTTTAKGTIPQTGESIAIIAIIATVAIAGTIGYISYRKNNY